MPLPDEIAWFSLASVDPLLVDHTLMRFLAQWWQDGDTGQICYGEFAGKLACIVVMDSQSSHVSLTTYISREPDNQVPDDPLICESCIQPGDFICIISGPHKSLCGMLHWHHSCKILITPSMLQQADPDNLRDKGKSRAQEPEVLSSDGNIDEGSDLIQVSVSMDEVLIIPPSTLQFSREKGYDVTISDCVHVAHGPAVGIEGLIHSVDFISGHLTVLADDGPLHNVLIGFCIKLENHSLHEIEHQLKNTAVITESGMFLNGAILDSTQMAAFIELCQKSFVWTVPHSTTPPMSHSTVDPSAESGPSTLACDPWVPHSDDTTPWPLNELVQADTDYRCVPWLFDNDFCDYVNWHVCLRVAVSYNCGLLLKQVVHTTVPDCFSMVIHGLGLAPPGHVSVTVTSSTYCLVLHGKLAGQIHWVKKCQVKKDLKGVELEDGTKLPLGDVCQGVEITGQALGTLCPLIA
ncbi:hypothetical protein EDC04DRAFT_2608603 [Pisolithus marmoratus]|nr:hypothetical protein EDC04DRAFT_2608603 [Pisolithus marmoratus]